MRAVVDQITFQRYRSAVDLATREGREIIEVLDGAGMLLTPLREHTIAVRAVKELITRLEQKTPAELMQFFWQRPEGTPREMFEAVLSWMEIWYNELAKRPGTTLE